MNKFQRGDIVTVTYPSGFTYEGVVMQSNDRMSYIVTRSSGYWQDNALLSLVRRTNKDEFHAVIALASAYE